MTAQEIYSQAIAQLPKQERLRLAALILQDLSDWASDPGYSGEWTDEDMRDLTAHAIARFEEQNPEEQ